MPVSQNLHFLGCLLLLLPGCHAEDTGLNGGSNQSPRAVARSCAHLVDTPIRLAGGTFSMGEDDVYAEEGPVRETMVRPFWIDPHEVTNRQFLRFVNATDYITIAEKPVDPASFGVPRSSIPADMLLPGSAVFVAPDFPSSDYADWWTYIPGTSWRKPYGPTGPEARPEVPVAHLAYADMQAYAQWRNGRLPTEAEWEYAAGAGSASNREQPVEANSWQGVFPNVNSADDGFKGIAPVGCYKPNDFGLYDMVGNMWEMTSDLYAPGHDPQDRDNPKGPSENTAYDPQNPALPTRVIKGGSYLCAPNYCQRYRSAARSGRDTSLGASNVGFRLVYDHPSR